MLTHSPNLMTCFQVPPFTRESPTTSKDTPTTTPTSEAKDVSEVTSSSEDPPAAPDSTTSKNLDASSSK